jgi:hypothetical protein
MGAQYLAGIAVECQAKWVLCERLGVRHVDEIDPSLVGHAGHDLERCLKAAGLLDRLARSEHAEAWRVVQAWTIEWRYEVPGSTTASHRKSEQFIEACERVFDWLRAMAT